MQLLTSLWWLSLPLSALGQLGSYNYVGGIPLTVPDDCPSGLVNGTAVENEQMCCPASQTFVKNENGAFCCGGESGTISF